MRAATSDRAMAVKLLRATPFTPLQPSHPEPRRKRTIYLLPNRTVLFTADRMVDSQQGCLRVSRFPICPPHTCRSIKRLRDPDGPMRWPLCSPQRCLAPNRQVHYEVMYDKIRHSIVTTAQTAQVRGFGSPRTCAVPALIRLHFRSAFGAPYIEDTVDQYIFKFTLESSFGSLSAIGRIERSLSTSPERQ